MAEIIKILEIIGTIAFAVSGALVAIGANLDIIGVVFLGCITAVGGGILRDIILGITPPSAFVSFEFCAVAAVVSVIVFVVSMLVGSKFSRVRDKIEQVNNFFDAIGLAAFTITGAEIACIHGYYDNAFIVVVLGMITGVGGGIFRDILSDTTPAVLRKHIYALASVCGAVLFFIIRKYVNTPSAATVLSMLLVFAIRMLATKYRWSLPKIEQK